MRRVGPRICGRRATADPFSQLALAIPILLLYEASIISVSIIERGRAKREAEEEAAMDDADDADL